MTFLWYQINAHSFTSKKNCIFLLLENFSRKRKSNKMEYCLPLSFTPLLLLLLVSGDKWRIAAKSVWIVKKWNFFCRTSGNRARKTGRSQCEHRETHFVFMQAKKKQDCEQLKIKAMTKENVDNILAGDLTSITKNFNHFSLRKTAAKIQRWRQD